LGAKKAEPIVPALLKRGRDGGGGVEKGKRQKFLRPSWRGLRGGEENLNRRGNQDAAAGRNFGSSPGEDEPMKGRKKFRDVKMLSSKGSFLELKAKESC